MTIKHVAVVVTGLALAGGFSYSPALAISPSEPGYYNLCQQAWVNDPATYDRDCAGTNNPSLTGPVEEAPCPEYVTMTNFTYGMVIKVADISGCYYPA